MFTNLTPEHIEAHGGFENYKKAKGKLFQHLTSMPKKIINGKVIEKISVVNADDDHADYFIDFDADRHVQFSWSGKATDDRVVAKYKLMTARETKIEGLDEIVRLNLRAEFEHKNELAAIATVHALEYPNTKVVQAAKTLK